MGVDSCGREKGERKGKMRENRGREMGLGFRPRGWWPGGGAGGAVGGPGWWAARLVEREMSE